MPKDLIEFWQQCTLPRPPFAHPEDLEILRKKDRWLIENDATDFDSYIKGPRFGDQNDGRLHLSLLPVPYVGDLQNAEIVILLLNPGFEYSDYWVEERIPEFRKRLEQNLHQSFQGVEYPFFYLDPQFCCHSGFVWWERKLRDVIQQIAFSRFNGNYREALCDLSRKLACMELVPYHSVYFGDHNLIGQLPSVKKARDFVLQSLIPDAALSKRTLIVTRQAKGWGLAPVMRNQNVIIYEGGHTRGASLSGKSEGGKAILKKYNITTTSLTLPESTDFVDNS